MLSRHPSVKWAQRSDKLFITVELPDAKNVKFKLEPEGKFYFAAEAGADNTPFEVDFELFDKVDVNESKGSTTSRYICYLIKKAENKWWSRLLKQEGKPPVFLKVDWDKWVDEDEQDEKPGAGMDFGDDFDFSNLSMGGPGDFDPDAAGDADDDDSDTDEEGKEIETGPASSELQAHAPSSEPETKA
nr:co-chaperone protein P23-1-like [Ipomoea batatas]GMC54620.1 co-chaperone protein P23-1-like [Ipomoea batatas]